MITWTLDEAIDKIQSEEVKQEIIWHIDRFRKEYADELSDMTTELNEAESEREEYEEKYSQVEDVISSIYDELNHYTRNDTMRVPQEDIPELLKRIAELVDVRAYEVEVI